MNIKNISGNIKDRTRYIWTVVISLRKSIDSAWDDQSLAVSIFFIKWWNSIKSAWISRTSAKKFLLTDWRDMRRKYNRNIVDLWTSWSSFKWTSIDFLDPQNTHEKNYWTHQIPTRKTFQTKKYPREKLLTQEVPTRRKLGPTKVRWYNGTRPTRPRWHKTHIIWYIH